MAQFSAPVRGHRTASARANCPACGSRYGNYRSYHYSPYPYSYSSRSSGGSSKSSGLGKSGRMLKASWSPAGSSVYYTPNEIRTLTPIHETIVERSTIPDVRDVFLCHAWNDRKGAAKDLCNQLELNGVSVWFSEKDILLGAPFLREIDKGLAKSRVGIVLVTPSFLKRVQSAGVADKELSALLARNLLIPVVHNTTYDALRDVSPLLGSRNGLDTSEDPLESVAIRLADLVKVDDAMCN